jgi:Zn-dependent metalloprotease
MKNIQHPNCAVIPGYMLDRLAEHDESRDVALRTLDAMTALASHRHSPDFFIQAAQPARKRRSVYDAQHQRRLPGRFVMNEHRTRGNDIAVNQAYDGTGVMLDFLAEIIGVISIDGLGMRIILTVHYGSHFCNAMWDGRQMIFGDGDGRIFKPFTSSADVIFHEIAHGWTQFHVRLGYTGQNGALNEHLSDVIASIIKQWMLDQTVNQADWYIGDLLFEDGILANGIRSMSAPGTAYDDPILGKDPQPAHMRDYVKTRDDNGGVHLNCGIPNHAFFLTAVGMGGFSWENAGLLWLNTAKERVAPDADFNDFARATVDYAHDKYPVRVQQAVVDAWFEVGIAVQLVRAKVALSQPTPAAKKWRERPAV